MITFEINTPRLDFDVGATPQLEFDVGTAVLSALPYQGECEATPSNEEQIFYTNGKAMPQNFVVHPIPSNYGLITYNGYDITVS